MMFQQLKNASVVVVDIDFNIGVTADVCDIDSDIDCDIDDDALICQCHLNHPKFNHYQSSPSNDRFTTSMV